MKFRDLFEEWNLTGLKIKTPILEMEWSPSDADRDAAWDLYVELLTRIATQPLSDDTGVESRALESIHNLFPITRQILKEHGRKAVGLSRVAIIVLNQIVRPFTSKWHLRSRQGVFEDSGYCQEFREELSALQEQLRRYCGLLAELAAVEDLLAIKAESDE